MKAKRYTEEQIIGVLREAEVGAKTKDLCRKYGISEPPFYTWKAKYGGMTVSEARRRKALEAENSKLKKLLAESELDKAALKDLLGRNGKPAGEAPGGGRAQGGTRAWGHARLWANRHLSVPLRIPRPANR